MRNKLANQYELVAQRTGLRLDRENGVLYGYRDTFPVTAAPVSGKPFQMQLILSVCAPEDGDAEAAVQQFAREQPAILAVSRKEHAWTFTLRTAKKPDQLAETMDETLSALTAFLRMERFSPCCSACGQPDLTTGYRLGEQFLQLCPGCAGQLSRQEIGTGIHAEEKPERPLAGLVGALLGALVGVVVMLLFSKFGIISALSGTVMALCTLKGYRMLGGRLTRKGALLCIAVMAGMIFAGDYLDWSLRIASALDLPFGRRDVFYLMDSGAVSALDYGMNLVLLYVFAFLGARTSVHQALHETSGIPSLSRIGATGSNLKL